MKTRKKSLLPDNHLENFLNMEDKKKNQDNGSKNGHQEQHLPDQKKQAPSKQSADDLPGKNDDDQDEDENHYNDTIKEE